MSRLKEVLGALITMVLENLSLVLLIIEIIIVIGCLAQNF